VPNFSAASASRLDNQRMHGKAEVGIGVHAQEGPVPYPSRKYRAETITGGFHAGNDFLITLCKCPVVVIRYLSVSSGSNFFRDINASVYLASWTHSPAYL
jgi:hypothetical protein